MISTNINLLCLHRWPRSSKCSDQSPPPSQHIQKPDETFLYVDCIPRLAVPPISEHAASRPAAPLLAHESIKPIEQHFLQFQHRVPWPHEPFRNSPLCQRHRFQSIRVGRFYEYKWTLLIAAYFQYASVSEPTKSAERGGRRSGRRRGRCCNPLIKWRKYVPLPQANLIH